MRIALFPVLLALFLCSQASVAGPDAAPNSPGSKVTPPVAKAPAAKAILGKWKKVGTEGVVEVTEASGVFNGKLIKSEKEKELVGQLLFRDLKFNAEKRLYEGKIYSPERKRLYDATYTVTGNKLTLTVKGRTVEWERA